MISLAKCSVRPLIILLVAKLAESTFIAPVPMHDCQLVSSPGFQEGRYRALQLFCNVKRNQLSGSVFNRLRITAEVKALISRPLTCKH